MACMLRELIGIFHCFFYFVKKIVLYIYIYIYIYIYTPTFLLTNGKHMLLHTWLQILAKKKCLFVKLKKK